MYQIRHNEPPPQCAERFSFTALFSSMNVSDCFDVPYSKRKNLSYSVAYYKRANPGTRFTTRVMEVDGIKVVRCFRMPNDEEAFQPILYEFTGDVYGMLPGRSCFFIGLTPDDVRNFTERRAELKWRAYSKRRAINGKMVDGIVLQRIAQGVDA